MPQLYNHRHPQMCRGQQEPNNRTKVTPIKTQLKKKALCHLKLFHPYTPYQVTQLLESKEVRLELKRKECGDRVLRDNKIFHLAVPILISQLKILSFHIVVGQGWQRNKHKRVMHIQICCFAHKTLLCFRCSYCCCQH